jgi:catechol 2,3-dioxygenase-like lactoylglutathione lyase family enzyme
MHDYISGIQQVGIGVKNLRESMLLYKELFGLDVLIFDDTSDASLMTQYTGGEVCNRQAVLTMNLSGGGGFEIWQFNNRDPKQPTQGIIYGDLGINAVKIKCGNTENAHSNFLLNKNISVSALQKDPAGNKHFWLKDAQQNWFNITGSNDWFKQSSKKTGAVTGAVIGVSNLQKSLVFYKDFLGINEVVYDTIGTFSDNHKNKEIYCRRVLLRKKTSGKGAFNQLLGAVEIELVQVLDREPATIFKDRFWGDCGFIHLCFDVLEMDSLKAHAVLWGIQFTVDSENSFEMENAAGRFCYVEDPDGTLIELVETHKIPILKKFNWYLNLQKRDRQKPLPKWMINMLALSKVK